MSIGTGKLSQKPIGDLLREIAGSGLTGLLRITRDKAIKAIFFESGAPVYAISNLAEEQPEQALLDTGLATDEQIEAAKKANPNAQQLLKTLVEMNILNDQALHRCLRDLAFNIILSMFECAEADYAFTPKLIAKHEIKLECSIIDCISSGARLSANRLDVLNSFAPPTLVVVTDPRASKLVKEVKLSSVEGYVLSCLTSPTPAGEASAFTGLSDIDTRKAVYVLLQLGLLSASRTGSGTQHSPASSAETISPPAAPAKSAASLPAQHPAAPTKPHSAPADSTVRTSPAAPADQSSRTQAANPAASRSPERSVQQEPKPAPTPAREQTIIDSRPESNAKDITAGSTPETGAADKLLGALPPLSIKERPAAGSGKSSKEEQVEEIDLEDDLKFLDGLHDLEHWDLEQAAKRRGAESILPAARPNPIAEAPIVAPPKPDAPAKTLNVETRTPSAPAASTAPSGSVTPRPPVREPAPPIAASPIAEPPKSEAPARTLNVETRTPVKPAVTAPPSAPVTARPPVREPAPPIAASPITAPAKPEAPARTPNVETRTPVKPAVTAPPSGPVINRPPAREPAPRIAASPIAEPPKPEAPARMLNFETRTPVKPAVTAPSSGPVISRPPAREPAPPNLLAPDFSDQEIALADDLDFLREPGVDTLFQNDLAAVEAQPSEEGWNEELDFGGDLNFLDDLTSESDAHGAKPSGPPSPAHPPEVIKPAAPAEPPANIQAKSSSPFSPPAAGMMGEGAPSPHTTGRIPSGFTTSTGRLEPGDSEQFIPDSAPRTDAAPVEGSWFDAPSPTQYHPVEPAYPSTQPGVTHPFDFGGGQATPTSSNGALKHDQSEDLYPEPDYPGFGEPQFQDVVLNLNIGPDRGQPESTAAKKTFVQPDPIRTQPAPETVPQPPPERVTDPPIDTRRTPGRRTERVYPPNAPSSTPTPSARTTPIQRETIYPAATKPFVDTRREIRTNTPPPVQQRDQAPRFQPQPDPIMDFGPTMEDALHEVTIKLNRMNSAADYYGVLGLTKIASNGSILKAYESMTEKFGAYRSRFPDETELAGKVEKLLAKVNEAYATLGNPEKRRIYDIPSNMKAGSAPTDRGRQDNTRPVGARPPIPAPITPPIPRPIPPPIQPSSQYRPTPSAQEYRPTPSSSEYRPTPPAQEYRPTPSSSEYRPTAPAQEYRPTPPAQEYRPTPSSSEYRPTAPAQEYRPTPTPPPIQPPIDRPAPMFDTPINTPLQRTAPIFDTPINTPIQTPTSRPTPINTPPIEMPVAPPNYQSQMPLGPPPSSNPYESADHLFRQGKAYHERNDFHTAAHMLRQAVRLDPNRASYHYYLGLTLSVLSQARQIHSHHEGCHVTCNLGGGLTRNQKVRHEAEQHFLRAAELDPSNADFKMRLGLLYKEAGIPKKAEQYFHEALLLDASNEQARIELGLQDEPSKKGPRSKLKDMLKS